MLQREQPDDGEYRGQGERLGEEENVPLMNGTKQQEYETVVKSDGVGEKDESTVYATGIPLDELPEYFDMPAGGIPSMFNNENFGAEAEAADESSTAEFDCRRLPKIKLSVISLILFGCAFAVPILNIPLYQSDSPYAGSPGFDPYYDATQAPAPDAIAYVYLLQMQACINNQTIIEAIQPTNGTMCSPFKSILFSMNSQSLEFEIQGYQFVPGVNVEFVANPTIMITGTLALMIVLPLFIFSTALYFASLFGNRRHFATGGAVVGFAVFCLAMPIAAYGISVDNFSTVSFTDQVGISQSSVAGALVMTAVVIQILLICSTAVFCCCCNAPRRTKNNASIEIDVSNNSVQHIFGAKSAGLRRLEVVFNIVLWLLSIYLWVTLFLQPYCAYITQCPSQYMPSDNCDSGQCPSYNGCSGSVCSNMSSYGFGRGWIPFWVAHIVVAFFSPASRALRNAHSRVGIKSYVETLKSKPPHLWFHIQNYYIERILITTTTNGLSYTHVEERRVNTHAARGSFDYPVWVDVTPPLIIPGSLSSHLRGSPTRIHATKSYSFMNQETRREYQRQLYAFVRQNEIQGQSKEVTTGLEVEGFQEFGLAYQQYDNADAPTFFRYRWHLLSSILMVTPLYEFIFYAETMSAQLNLRKVVSA